MRYSLRPLAYSLARRVDSWTTPEVRQALAILHAGERATAPALQDTRDRAFADLVQHAYEHVPYYRRMMDERGIRPASVHALADLERFPVLTKDIVRAAGNDLYATNIPAEACIVRRSGGTTGEPITVRVDRRARALETYAVLRGLQWMGYSPELHTVRLFGGSLGRPRRPGLRQRVREYVLGVFFLPAFELRRDNARDYLRAIEQLGPCVMNGYASALYNLAFFAQDEPRGDLQVRSVFSTAEMLQPEWATLIERVFACPVKSYYGCGELNSLGFQVDANGPYWIPDEHVAIESVEPGQTAGVDAEHTLLVTALYNRAQPMIRYQNGDLGEVAAPGQVHPTRHAITRLWGRSADMLVREDGSRVSASLAPHMIFVTQLPVRRYQLVQWSPRRLEFRYEPVGSDLAPAHRTELTAILRRILGPNLQVEFVRTSEFLLSPQGKYRIILVKC